jgi:hypothetical protein
VLEGCDLTPFGWVDALDALFLKASSISDLDSHYSREDQMQTDDKSWAEKRSEHWVQDIESLDQDTLDMLKALFWAAIIEALDAAAEIAKENIYDSADAESVSSKIRALAATQ